MGANTTERVPVFQGKGLWKPAKNPLHWLFEKPKMPA
jgi:hypothetical protein